MKYAALLLGLPLLAAFALTFAVYIALAYYVRTIVVLADMILNFFKNGAESA